MFKVLFSFVLVGLLGFCVWFYSKEPSHDLEWLPEYSKLPYANMNGDIIHINNIRDFNYRSETDYDVRYIDETYNVNDLEGIDVAFSYWDNNLLIAHFIVIFKFDDKPNLALSVETRREVGEEWNPYGGFLRQFELIYILTTESDVIKLRTNHRKEDVFLYKLDLKDETVKHVFLNVLKKVNEIYVKPIFYNTVVENCTSSLLEVTVNPDEFSPFMPQLMMNGMLDHYLYENDFMPKDESYWSLKQQSYITPKAQLFTGGDYSAFIRQ